MYILESKNNVKDHYLFLKNFERRMLHKSHEEECVMPLPRSKKSAGREGGLSIVASWRSVPIIACSCYTLGESRFIGAAVSILSPFEIRTFCIAFATFYCLSHFICYTTKLRKVQIYKPYPLSPICFHLVI